jgi:hypothetical protein
MRMNAAELDSLKLSRDCNGVYKQYNPRRQRWEIRVLGRPLSTAPWSSWTRLLRVVKDEAAADARLAFLRGKGASLMRLDEYGMLVRV